MRIAYSAVCRGYAKTDHTATAAKSKATGKIRGNAPLMTDEQILECRALDQFAGWGTEQLQRRYGVDAAMIQRVLSGITRSRLVATRKHLPAVAA
ncbi:hypothetical protein FHR70_000685 [Microvirga lupini]|uniref:Uncharacterized protein n=1 Tax=Microvirga lupini TaxID=420324 RepID=A0A7W4YUR1_9HYPH|nr:hypothetical protein [Microvirga lupini]MBB3017645.1 hypothetical protein [Microvirga lupini]